MGPTDEQFLERFQKDKPGISGDRPAWHVLRQFQELVAAVGLHYPCASLKTMSLRLRNVYGRVFRLLPGYST